MDMDEAVAAKPKAAVEPEAEAEKTISIKAIDFYALQESLVGIQFELADIQRDAHLDKLEADERYETQQAMLRAILARLPSASGACSSALQLCVEYSHPLHYIVLFSISTHYIVQFKFVGVYTFCS